PGCNPAARSYPTTWGCSICWGMCMSGARSVPARGLVPMVYQLKISSLMMFVPFGAGCSPGLRRATARRTVTATGQRTGGSATASASPGPFLDGCPPVFPSSFEIIVCYHHCWRVVDRDEPWRGRDDLGGALDVRRRLVANQRHAAGPAPRGSPGPGGLEPVRRPVWAEDPAVVPRLGAAGLRRRGRDPGRAGEAPRRDGAVRLRSLEEFPRLAEDAGAPCLAGPGGRAAEGGPGRQRPAGRVPGEPPGR